jgi:hypothetical protein
MCVSQMFYVVQQETTHPFKNGLSGLLKLLIWDIVRKYVMIKKIRFWEASDLIAAPWLYNFGEFTL